MTDTSELICVPSAIPAGERMQHFALASELFGKRVIERRDLPDGYAMRFSQDDSQAVTRFIANERLCCPFLRFEMHAQPDAGSFWLQLTGPEGTREVLQAELNLADSCGCDSPPGAIRQLTQWATFAGVVCALAVCTAGCLLPFVLIGLGVTGTWVSGLQALSRYQWLFIAATVAFLGYGFRSEYRRGVRGSAAVRVGLWIATLLAISGIAFERIEPLLRG